MTLDINRTKEILEMIHPYLRWIMLATYAGMFLYINRMFMTDPVLRKWLMASLEETPNRASGKSLTAFVFAKLVAFATMVAIVYSPAHLLPEYFLISLLTFIGSVYGIKLAGKYFSGDKGKTEIAEAPVTENVVKGVPNNTEKPKDENKSNSDDIG